MKDTTASTSMHSMHCVFLEDASLEEIETYYDVTSIQVKNDLDHPIQPYKGVYACTRFEIGDQVFRECPLVAMQHSDSARTMMNCHECLGFVGTSIDDQLVHYMKQMEIQEQAGGRLNKEVERDGVVLCPECEQVWYCSEACRDASWKRHHSLMCPGLSHDGKEWWDSFYEHASSTNEIFILAGKAMSIVLLDAYSKLEHMSPMESLLDAWRPFKMGYKKKWWDSVALPGDVDPQEEEQFRADLKELANDSFTLYSHAVELGHPNVYSTCIEFIHLDIWGSLIGMFELNNLSILGAGPCNIFPCDDEHIKAILQDDEAVEEFMDAIVEGTGFYRVHSCMNHSCEPNCRVMLPETRAEYNTAIIQAIRPIDPGTELTVSYIEEDEPYDVRQEQLRDYGFECMCSKCTSCKKV